MGRMAMDARPETSAPLAGFLRACRSRVSPADVGLPDDGRVRRVPGLRREELAQLANVSVDYLVRVEQGRTTNVSPAVLESLATALRLADDERSYLLRIAGPARRTAAPRTGGPHVRPQTRQLLDGLREMPAIVLGRRLDVLAWNPLAAALLGDFGALPDAERNLVRLAFLCPGFRALYADWPTAARECVAYLRMDAARYADDPLLAALVGELSVKDPDFRRWWADQRVRTRAFGRKAFRHPLAGPLELEFQTLTVGDDADQTMIVYTAEPESRSAEALRFLAGWAATGATAATVADADADADADVEGVGGRSWDVRTVEG